MLLELHPVPEPQGGPLPRSIDATRAEGNWAQALAYLGRVEYLVVVGATGTSPKAVVVVADDDRASREHLAQLLRERDFIVAAASSGQKAIDAVRAQPVDLVVLDVNMPGLDGVDTCRVIKTITKDRFVPIVLLTPPGDASARVQGLRTGADDHLTKPVDDAELLACVDNMLRVKRTHDDVEFAKSELRYASLDAQLGALPDQRYFYERLKREFAEAARHLDPLACCIVAVDGLRKLVVEHGPDVAASVLDELFDRVQRTIRATDVATRFRTTDFGLILPNTRPARALTLADCVVTELASRPIETNDVRVSLTVSIGVGVFPSANVRSDSELLDAASIAVARAQVAGTNRVCVVQQQGYIFSPTLPGAA
ncbi:MAG: response regulator [Polyangiales bacterium]